MNINKTEVIKRLNALDKESTELRKIIEIFDSQWIYLKKEHYDTIEMCDSDLPLVHDYKSWEDDEWYLNDGAATASHLQPSKCLNSKHERRILTSEWAKVESHLAELVPLPDDLIPPGTQIVGGVPAVNHLLSQHCIILDRSNGSVAHPCPLGRWAK